jgi:hypothetical protein
MAIIYTESAPDGQHTTKSTRVDTTSTS